MDAISETRVVAFLSFTPAHHLGIVSPQPGCQHGSLEFRYQARSDSLSSIVPGHVKVEMPSTGWVSGHLRQSLGKDKPNELLASPMILVSPEQIAPQQPVNGQKRMLRPEQTEQHVGGPRQVADNLIAGLSHPCVFRLDEQVRRDDEVGKPFAVLEYAVDRRAQESRVATNIVDLLSVRSVGAIRSDRDTHGSADAGSRSAQRIPAKLMHDIKANALKALIAPADLLLRRVLFNTQPPSVARVSPDVSYGPDVEQRMDIIEPHREEPLPVLLYFHGGGWISGDKASHERICRSLATNGFVTFNTNYRLAPRHRFPAQVQDVARAVEWVCRHAHRYGGDASRVVLAGDSAGAHLASWYGTCLGNLALQRGAGIEMPLPHTALMGIVLFYGIYDLETARGRRFPFVRLYVRSLMDGDRPASGEMLSLASPARHISANLPPIFLCAGEKDGLFPESVAYAEGLGNFGVDLTTLFFSRTQHPEAMHGFLYLHRLACTMLALDEVGKFLSHCTRNSSAAARRDIAERRL